MRMSSRDDHTRRMFPSKKRRGQRKNGHRIWKAREPFENRSHLKCLPEATGDICPVPILKFFVASAILAATPSGLKPCQLTVSAHMGPQILAGHLDPSSPCVSLPLFGQPWRVPWARGCPRGSRP